MHLFTYKVHPHAHTTTHTHTHTASDMRTILSRAHQILSRAERRGKLVRMEQVEVRDESGVHDEVSRDPGALLWTVPLPIHQIMDPTSMAAGAEEMQGRRGRNGRNQRAFLDGFDPGDMEGWVDPHGTRKLKAYRLWVYGVGYGKWFYELGGQLGTPHFKGRSRVESQTFWPS